MFHRSRILVCFCFVFLFPSFFSSYLPSLEGVGVALVEGATSPPLNILWDLNHGVKEPNGSIVYDPRVNGSYLQDGVNVFQAKGSAFYFTQPCLTLDQYPLYFVDMMLFSGLTSRNGNYAASELAAINNFVNLGGSLFVNFDDPTADPNYLMRSILQATTGNATLDTSTPVPSNILSNLLNLLTLNLYFNAGAELSYNNASTAGFFSALATTAQTDNGQTTFIAFTQVEKCANSCRVLASCDTEALLRPDLGPSGSQNLQQLEIFLDWFLQAVIDDVLSLLSPIVFVINGAEKIVCSAVSPSCTLAIPNNSTGGSVSVNVGLGLVSEINSINDNIVKSVNFSTLPFVVTTLNSILELPGLRYQAKASSGELFQLAFQGVETGTNVSFAGENFFLPAGSLEWAVSLTGWTWANVSNHLQISFPISSNTSAFLYYTKTPNPDNPNSTLYYLYTTNSQVRLQVVNIAIVDGCPSTVVSHSVVGIEEVSNGTQAKMRNDWNGTFTVTLEVIFPHFNNFIMYDPDMGVLLDQGSSGTGGDGATGDGSTNTLLIVLTSVLIPLAALVVIGVMAATGFILWKERKLFGSIKLFDTVQLPEIEDEHPTL